MRTSFTDPELSAKSEFADSLQTILMKETSQFADYQQTDLFYL